MRNILLVDDHPANLLALEELLAEFGENLVRANSGEEALKRVLETDFAVILLDVLMPTMGGFEVAQLLRSRPRTRLTPIIFLTATEGTPESMQAAYALGAVDFLTKPVNPWALKAKVATFVELDRNRAELRAAERQATTGRAFLGAVLEAVEDGIVACDAQGVLTLFNRATRELHGLPEAPLPQEQWSRHYGLFREDGVTPMPPGEIPLGRALRGEHVKDVPLVVVANGKAPRFLLASGRPLFDEGGEKLGAVVSMHDVTATREAESARLASAHEQAARAAAEAVAERQRDFLATLAHELRNPLAPIRNGLEVMRLGAEDPNTVRKTREMVVRQVNHLVHLVDDLLDLARISSGKLTLKPRVSDLRGIVERALETCAPLVAASGHAFSVSLPEAPVMVMADEVRMAQVVGNLVNNAVKYTPAGGSITVDAHVEGGQALVCVTDTGVGIAREALPHVFEMFTQVGGSLDRAQGGLGIGLSISRRIVEMHGGTITAQSDGAGQGSTFMVRLPAN